MKKGIYIFLGVLLTACYDDKGSYDYHDINEVTIGGIKGSYTVATGVNTLEIDPVVEMTQGDPEDTTRFRYEWRANVPYNDTWLIGTERVLQYPVELEPRDYTLYFRVIDKETDVVAVATASLSVGTPYTKGILLIGENEQEEADVQMLSMTLDTVLYKDLLKNKGLPALKDPIDIIHTGGSAANMKLWVLTKSRAYSMDRATFKGSVDNVFSKYCFFSQSYDTDFVPVDFIPRIKDKAGNSDNYNRATVCSNGYVFASSLLILGGDYYVDPVNHEEATPGLWLKSKPWLLYSLNKFNGFLWYDETNERFMLVKSTNDSYSLALTDWPEDPFPWNQKSLGRTMIYGENTFNRDDGSTNGNSFAIMRDSDGKHYVYKFYVSTDVSKRNCYAVSNVAIDFGKADFYAFSSRRSVVYYVVNSKLYAYDYNKGNEKLYSFDLGGDQITMLKCDTQIDPTGNPLYIATYNPTTGGTLQKYIQGTNPDKVELIPDRTSCWTGLTKIKNMSWRAVN